MQGALDGHDRTRTPSWLRALHAVRIRRNLLGPHRGYRSKYGSISMPNRPTPLSLPPLAATTGASRYDMSLSSTCYRGVFKRLESPTRAEAVLPTILLVASTLYGVNANGRTDGASALRDSDSAIRNPAGSVTVCAATVCAATVCASGKAETGETQVGRSVASICPVRPWPLDLSREFVTVARGRTRPRCARAVGKCCFWSVRPISSTRPSRGQDVPLDKPAQTMLNGCARTYRLVRPCSRTAC